MEPNKKLLLLDAYALIFRAFYAMIRSPRVTSTGIDTSAVFGFVNTLQDLLKRQQPSHIAVCFDPPGGTFRHESYEAYKANREKTPEGILQAVPFIKRILAAYRIPIFEIEGFEADDVIGTLSHQAEQQGFFTYMVTADKDFGQLVTPNIKVLNPSKNEILGVEEVKEKYGIQSPTQLIDILGLMGDTADNIPGCPGVGPKNAEKLIQQFGSIENLLEHTDELKGAQQQRIIENAEQIRLSKWLATIITDVPITLDADALKREPANMEALRQVFNELEFRTLTQRLIDGGEANVGLGEAPAVTSAPSAQSSPSSTSSKSSKSSKSTARQLSLFDLDEPAPVPSVPSYQSLSDITTDYRLITSPIEATALVSDMLTQPRVAISMLGSGEAAMQLKIIGVALCASQHQAAFVMCDDKADILRALAPLFSGKACIVSSDIKRTIVALRQHGIPFTAHYYDTAVAHYLLQPERGHSTAEMAYELLHYSAISPESLLGPKGRNQLKPQQLSPEALSRWTCEAADLTLQLPDVLDQALKEQGLYKLLTDIELPLVEVLAGMELAGARIDVKALNEYSVSLTNQMNRLEAECHQLAGMSFNTASPAQVGEVLFDYLKIDPKAKKTKTGQYSTTEDILLKLRDRHPLVDKILELRGIRKLLSTYVNALPALINPQTGRIHTTYNQTVTATGRLSSTNPNLQNIPVRTDDGKEIRRAFIPADGNVFFSADYSQIELRLVADMSHDKTMIDAFAHGHDIHAITAARIYHKPLDQVTADERRKAKTANFGILYGISAFGLAQRLNIPRDEAKMLIDGYYTTFPQVRDYIDSGIAQAREKGFVTTLYGRRRMLPDINSRNAVVRAFSERNAINAPIQGTAADIIKLAMVHIYRRFSDEGIRSQMILQVHDELNFDVIPTELDQVQRIVIEEMQNVYKGNVQLTASHGTASNWLDAH